MAVDTGAGTTRRLLLTGVGAMAGTLAMPGVIRAQTKKTASVIIGRQPYAAGNSPVSQYMIEQRLVEKAAAALGYDLTVAWQDYPSAVPMVEAFLSGNLDIGMWGNTPIVRLIAQKQPINVMCVGRRTHALRARHPARFHHSQHRRPEGQDGGRAGRRRPLQRPVADAAR